MEKNAEIKEFQCFFIFFQELSKQTSLTEKVQILIVKF